MTDLWRPILDDAMLRRAREVLRRLADTLLINDRVTARGSDGSPKRAALLVGLPGQAIAHAYLARAELGEVHGQRAEALLEQALAEVGELYNGGLIRGYAGPAFALEHLCGDPSDPDDVNAHVDAMLVEELGARADLPLEYMNGLAGRAVYARERLARPSGAELYAALAERMIGAAKHDADGARWVVGDREDDGPPRSRDLRVAWGTVGIVSMLASCPVHADALTMARDAMRWIWAQRRESPGSMYPMSPDEPARARPGWCAGDVGLGAVLLQAARAVGDAEWQGRWLQVLRESANRLPDPDYDLTYCHGAAGIAHAFARGSQYTGDARLREASRRWYEFLLERLDNDRAQPSGILDGLSGIALVLAAAITDLDPAWDRLFLLS